MIHFGKPDGTPGGGKPGDDDDPDAGTNSGGTPGPKPPK